MAHPSGLIATLPELIALKPHRVRRLPARRTADIPGMRTTRRQSRGMTFAEVRPYHVGDEVRHMDWRVTARTGKPHVKMFEEENEQTVLLCIDFNPSLFFGTRVAFKSVIAARLASLFAWETLFQKDSVGAFMWSQDSHIYLPPVRREKNTLTLLSTLAAYTEKHPASYHASLSFRERLTQLQSHIRPGTRLIFISDFYGMSAADMHTLCQLKSRCSLHLFHLFDPLEFKTPLPGLYPLTDGQHRIRLDLTQPALRRSYQHTLSTWQEMISAEAKAAKVTYSPVLTTDDLAYVVAQTYPRRRHGS